VRLGVFGGSFDPVHLGHLLLAEACREGAGLDRVVFVPAALAPHKTAGTRASAQHRLAMLALAVAGNDRFAVSTLEIDRGGVSYTVDTLAAVHREHPSATLHLILGPDSLEQFPTWRDPAGILSLARLVAVEREGLDDVAAICASAGIETLLGAAGVRAVIDGRVSLPAIGLRSTEIRARRAAGLGIRYRVPAAVERYIVTHELYRAR
jgi:nicotinate-nucleotide adenylyltransferase